MLTRIPCSRCGTRTCTARDWLTLRILRSTEHFEASNEIFGRLLANFHWKKKRKDTWIYNICLFVIAKHKLTIGFSCACGLLIHSFFDNVITKFMINNGTDAYNIWPPFYTFTAYAPGLYSYVQIYYLAGLFKLHNFCRKCRYNPRRTLKLRRKD